MDYEREMKLKLNPSALKGAGATEAKLTFEQRCAILALDKIDTKRTTIAAAYNIARPTVAYICNSASKHYRNVRNKYAELGRDLFMRTYLTEDAIERINKARDTLEAKATDAEHKELRRFDGTANGPNRAYKQKEGQHQFWHDFDKKLYLCEIHWYDELPPDVFDVDAHFGGPGWYAVETIAHLTHRGIDVSYVPENFTAHLFPDMDNPGPALTSTAIFKRYCEIYGVEELKE